MIPADILTGIAIIVIGGPLAWLLVIWTGRSVARKRARLIWPPGWRDKDRNEPESYGDEVTDEHFSQIAALVDQDQFDDWGNCGDRGGMPEPVKRARPKAPETGSGLLVEDVLDMPRFLRRKAGD
jgi:hypothetical protein